MNNTNLAEQSSEIIEFPNKSTVHTTYKGVEYVAEIDDKTGRYFIIVDGEKKFLDKNLCVCNKQKGRTSKAHAFESFDDIKKIQDYFLQSEEQNKYLFYLLFTINSNFQRRIGDLLMIKWSDLFYQNGKIKTRFELVEEKTGKNKTIVINAAIQEALKVYLEHETSIDFAYDYNELVFKQLHGNYRGKVLSKEGYRQALKKATEYAELDYNVASHSGRKTFGSMSLELHPNDVRSKTILMEIFNHSSEKVTDRYVGATEKMEEQYVNDYGDAYLKYVMHGEKIPMQVKHPVVSFDSTELRDLIALAYSEGARNVSETDPNKHIEAINNIMDILESLIK